MVAGAEGDGWPLRPGESRAGLFEDDLRACGVRGIDDRGVIPRRRSHEPFESAVPLGECYVSYSFRNEYVEKLLEVL
jgi:hypothetical protein